MYFLFNWHVSLFDYPRSSFVKIEAKPINTNFYGLTFPLVFLFLIN